MLFQECTHISVQVKSDQRLVEHMPAFRLTGLERLGTCQVSHVQLMVTESQTRCSTFWNAFFGARSP